MNVKNEYLPRTKTNKSPPTSPLCRFKQPPFFIISPENPSDIAHYRAPHQSLLLQMCCSMLYLYFEMLGHKFTQSFSVQNQIAPTSTNRSTMHIQSHADLTNNYSFYELFLGKYTIPSCGFDSLTNYERVLFCNICRLKLNVKSLCEIKYLGVESFERTPLRDRRAPKHQKIKHRKQALKLLNTLKILMNLIEKYCGSICVKFHRSIVCMRGKTGFEQNSKHKEDTGSSRKRPNLCFALMRKMLKTNSK